MYQTRAMNTEIEVGKQWTANKHARKAKPRGEGRGERGEMEREKGRGGWKRDGGEKGRE
jgi:hypothetical protein